MVTKAKRDGAVGCAVAAVFFASFVPVAAVAALVGCSGRLSDRGSLDRGYSREKGNATKEGAGRSKQAGAGHSGRRSARTGPSSEPGVYHDPKTGLTWVKIQSGTFLMGSRKGSKNERPVHRVHVPTFWMSQTEITVAQYRKCVVSGSCHVPNNIKDNPMYASGCNYGVKNRDDNPVNCVLWKWARQYARWVGGRLPSESEWEYAARSRGKRKKYPWGSMEPTIEYAVMSHIGKVPDSAKCDETCPVCSRSAKGNTEQGLCDMAGNVDEYVEDRYHPSYVGAPNDGSAWVKGSKSTRVTRGGSGSSAPKDLRTTSRAPASKGVCTPGMGFRVAVSGDPRGR
jgi:formylglycine-generating enzyme required for sulfatase activity